MPDTKREQVLSVRDLDITFKTTAGPVHAIRGVNIDLYKGETVALVGESGSGKSVTMKAAMGILAQNAKVNSGSIQFSYHHADGSPETVDLLQKDKKWIRRHINGKRIAMVFQDPMTSLDPTMTIGKQIMEGMLWHFKMPKAEAYKKALELLETERYDLVLLDLNLPKKDGMTVLRTLRQTDRETPVLILSARGEVEDKVTGLDAGANDYLAKPFHLAELEARIRSLTLRQFTQQDVVLRCGQLTFDARARAVSANGQPLTLTRKETGILEYLMAHQGRPVSQEELMDHVWDNSVDSFSNSIRVHISALRKKLRTALGYDPVRNRIGEGYLMGGDEE